MEVFLPDVKGKTERNIMHVKAAVRQTPEVQFISQNLETIIICDKICSGLKDWKALRLVKESEAGNLHACKRCG